jgi:hypothetical protein
LKFNQVLLLSLPWWKTTTANLFTGFSIGFSSSSSLL